MNNIRSTLAIVWRIAAPYFRSEDKWAGRVLLAAVIAIELALVAIDVSAQPVEQPLLQRAAGEELGRLRPGNRRLYASWRPFCVVLVGLPALSQPVAADPLAALDDHHISRRVAARRQSLPHAAAGRRRRQSGPAHHRRRQAVRRANAEYRRRPAEFGRDAGVLCHHPVGTVGGRAAAHVRPRVRNPRLSGVGRADLCHLRNGADAVDRLAAGQSRFPAAALRGRFPLQPGAGARKFRTDRAVARRERRTAAAVGALRPRRRQLVRHHEPDQAADGVHHELRAGRGDLSLSFWWRRPISPTRSSSAA